MARLLILPNGSMLSRMAANWHKMILLHLQAGHLKRTVNNINTKEITLSYSG